MKARRGDVSDRWGILIDLAGPTPSKPTRAERGERAQARACTRSRHNPLSQFPIPGPRWVGSLTARLQTWARRRGDGVTGRRGDGTANTTAKLMEQCGRYAYCAPCARRHTTVKLMQQSLWGSPTVLHVRDNTRLPNTCTKPASPKACQPSLTCQTHTCGAAPLPRRVCRRHARQKAGVHMNMNMSMRAHEHEHAHACT